MEDKEVWFELHYGREEVKMEIFHIEKQARDRVKELLPGVGYSIQKIEVTEVEEGLTG